MSDFERANGELILFEESPLEKITATDLYKRPQGLLVPGTEQLYLPGEIVVGNYGVAGLVLIDTKPENRWSTYAPDPDGYRGDADWPTSLDELARRDENPSSVLRGSSLRNRGVDIEDPQQRAWFIGTAEGFKMIRVFITPRELVGRLAEVGRHIGLALLEECFNSEDVNGQIPHEEPMHSWPLYNEEDRSAKNFDDIFRAKLAAISNLLGIESAQQDFYVSFHGWPWHSEVTALGQASVYKSIAKFDSVLAALDRAKVIPTRGLEYLSEGSSLTELPPASSD